MSTISYASVAATARQFSDLKQEVKALKEALSQHIKDSKEKEEILNQYQVVTVLIEGT
jgi:hypothetical protein